MRYLLRSAPEMLAAAAGMNWQDFLSTVELQTLARRGPARRMRAGLGLMQGHAADTPPDLDQRALLEQSNRNALRCAPKASWPHPRWP